MDVQHKGLQTDTGDFPTLALWDAPGHLGTSLLPCVLGRASTAIPPFLWEALAASSLQLPILPLAPHPLTTFSCLQASERPPSLPSTSPLVLVWVACPDCLLAPPSTSLMSGAGVPRSSPLSQRGVGRKVSPWTLQPEAPHS